jgi:hypothetical protein
VARYLTSTTSREAGSSMSAKRIFNPSGKRRTRKHPPPHARNITKKLLHQKTQKVLPKLQKHQIKRSKITSKVQPSGQSPPNSPAKSTPAKHRLSGRSVN